MSWPGELFEALTSGSQHSAAIRSPAAARLARFADEAAGVVRKRTNGSARCCCAPCARRRAGRAARSSRVCAERS